GLRGGELRGIGPFHGPIMMPAMEQNLRVPGPTPLPPEALEAQSAPMIDHRGTEFGELLREISTGLAELIGTRGEVLLLTGSGSGALEAAVVNTLSPGDRVLAVTIGSFGDRFAKIATAFGAGVERFEVAWGEAADPGALAQHLAANPAYRAVLLTHNETSTGVTNPLRELAEAVRKAPGDPLVLVDGISGLGAMPFEMDGWGIDLVVSASQKAWMGSPGIAIAALGDRAWSANETARMPRAYWDLAEARMWAEKGQTPWTPAVSVLFGLRVGVRRLVAEGRERTWARHEAIAAAVQAGLEALGLRLAAAPAVRSSTVTAAWLPEGLEWAPFNAAMRARGLIVAGGQGQWAGRILRFGHMGGVGIDEMTDAVRIMGETLAEHGRQADAPAAVRVMREVFEARQAAPVG
ncbi:MAG TPA: alanine--glyoxylate aminotransferase family protein, partial [Candidatus Limnocylindria bacterium]